MKISVIRPSELGLAEISLWHFMQQQTESLANPFLSPEFAIAVDNVRSDARVAVLADGSEIVGFFPFESSRFGIAKPIGAGLADCYGLIHSPSAVVDPKELLRACKVAVWQFDNLVQGQQPFERYANSIVPSAVVDLSDGFPAYYQKLQNKSRQSYQNISRKARGFARNCGELHLTLDSRDITELRTLMGWKSAQYRRSGWSDIFSRSWVVSLIDYLFSIHNDRFSGLLSVLYAEDTPVAAHFGMKAGHVLSDWIPAYDIRFAKYSPGILHFLRMAEESTVLGVHSINTGTGSERYKQWLKNYDLFVARGVATQKPLLSSAFRGHRALTSWASLRIKQYPPLFRAAERLLQHYDRIG